MLFSKIFKFVNNELPRWFAMVAYSYLALIILFEVIRRYMFNASSPWGEMTARYAFVYLAYIAAAEAIRLRKHIQIDLIIKNLSKRIRLIFDLYIDLLTTGLALLVIYYSVQVIKIQWQVDIVMEAADINMAFAHIALPIGWGLIILRISQVWIQRCRPSESSPLREQDGRSE